MAEKYRLGIAGLVHDHVWKELGYWAETNRVEMAAAAEPNPPLQERVRKEFGVERCFDSVAQMLEESSLDIVQVCTTNAQCAEVVEAAAQRGIHAVVEKPMAATLEQADRMLSAANRAGTRLMINWPNRWRPNTMESWRLIQEGAIGQLFEARMRMAHEGPKEMGCSEYFYGWLYDASENGGGAIIDYCSYGAVAFRHLFGMPNSVQAVAARLVKNDIPVDDNASITCLYDDKFALAEASWSQVPPYHDAIYLGTGGTLWTEPGTIWIAEGKDRKRELPVPELPAGRRNGPEYFLTCLESGEDFTDTCHPGICRDAQEILEAGVKSARSGQRLKLPLASS